VILLILFFLDFDLDLDLDFECFDLDIDLRLFLDILARHLCTIVEFPLFLSRSPLKGTILPFLEIFLFLEFDFLFDLDLDNLFLDLLLESSLLGFDLDLDNKDFLDLS
jgi:hypothetical protein